LVEQKEASDRARQEAERAFEEKLKAEGLFDCNRLCSKYSAMPMPQWPPDRLQAMS